MSVYLTPKFVKADEQFRLTELAALAVKQSVDELLPSQSTIKWPNDILVEGRKIAGILIESTVQKNQLARCIIGIGINVNQTNFDASLGATSLKLELGRFVPIDHVLSLVCEALESLYLLAKRQPLAIHKAYEREMYKLNERVDFQIGDIRANYEVQGVNKFGLIQLKNGTGESRFYHFHEARFIRE